jgi:hypothetical protein
VTGYENAETKSRAELRDQILRQTMKKQQKITKNEHGQMDSMLYRGHRLLGGINHSEWL